jgi:hypothetical protein
MSDLLPIIILAGGNERVETVPTGLTPDDILRGFKGAVKLPSGRCIAGELIERICESGRFEKPILVGPRRIYRDLVACEISDTSGDLLATVTELTRLLAERYPDRPVAVSACDILPTAADFRNLLDESYAPYVNSGFWWQMIAAEPEEMGVSRWKPSYRMRLSPERPLLNLYPGHLLILRPTAIRLDWFNRFLMLAYRFRNRGLYERVIRITLRVMRLWLADDLRRVASFQWPGRVVAAPYGIFRTYVKYRLERVTVPDLADELTRQIMVPGGTRGLDHPASFAVTRIRSFAKDIDTRTELEEILRDGVADRGQDDAPAPTCASHSSKNAGP